MDLKEKFKKVGVAVPELVMPSRGVDLTKYAVIACDQYTSQPEYWDDVESIVGTNASTFYYIMPEAWLGRDGKPDSDIHANHQNLLSANMKFFLVNGSLTEMEPGMVYLERTLRDGSVRRGLVLALDLEQYDYSEGSKSLIRATEKTVAERIPARVAIRKSAPLECPHIMVLFADKRDKLMKMLSLESKGRIPLYDFDLMKGAGHLKGYHITDEMVLDNIADNLLYLKDESEDGMLFAIGDGNHSLAAAKANWESFRKLIPESQRSDHPARFALVELVNLYDPGLSFEPINRILYNVDKDDVQKQLGFDAANPISLQDLQPKLDAYLAEHSEASIDYIHGAETAKALAAKDPTRSLAICWDEFDRDSLFSDVIKNGSLVRKSFSMGHAEDKRFYLEARRITKVNKEHIVPNKSW